MSTVSDLIIPYSSLDFSANDRASIAQSTYSHEVLSALLMRVVRHFAETLAGGTELAPVSVTVDVTGQPDASSAISFDSCVDRKTRTLIFISGNAVQGDQHLLKATAVYRIG